MLDSEDLWAGNGMWFATQIASYWIPIRYLFNESILFITSMASGPAVVWLRIR